MEIGLQIAQFDWPGSPRNIGAKLIEITKLADSAGVASLWVMDHFFQVGQGYGPPESPMLEGYSVISYLASVTKKIKLGLMVTANPYRHPGMLIKIVTTLDVLSGGRAYLGIGTGWYKFEARALGVPFPESNRELIARLTETLQIAKHLWSGDTSPYYGKYYRLEEPINSPPPLSKPHPPILIGGEGEKKTLSLVAQYGDACNLQLGTPLNGYAPWLQEFYASRGDRLPRKLNILEEHCQKLGRDYADIQPTVLGAVKLAPDGMSASEIVELCHELADMGFQQVIFNMPNVHEIKPIEVIGNDIIPRVMEC